MSEKLVGHGYCGASNENTVISQTDLDVKLTQKPEILCCLFMSSETGTLDVQCD